MQHLAHITENRRRCGAKIGGNMRNILRIAALVILAISMVGGTSSATMFGEDITQYDGYSSTEKLWWSDREDEEVEPNAQTGQGWDLEGFFLDNTKLTVVGGFDFIAGNSDIYSGDIFIDVNGDVSYGVDDGQLSDNGGGYYDILNLFGYDYVLDLDLKDQDNLADPGTFAYTVYAIDETAVLKSGKYRVLDESSPYQYVSGGTEVDSGTFLYQAGLTDDEVGFAGGRHNALTVDLAFLPSASSFTTHFAQGCGNDNLMGYHGAAPVPEPATMVLFGTGLIGLAGIGRKKLAR